MDVIGDGWRSFVCFFIQSTIADDFMASTDAAILWVFKQIHTKALLRLHSTFDITSIQMDEYGIWIELGK